MLASAFGRKRGKEVHCTTHSAAHSPQFRIHSPHPTVVLEHAGSGAPPMLLWPSPAARGGEVAAARGGAGATLALLVTLLSVVVAAVLCWKGAAAWQRIRLGKAQPRRAGAGAWRQLRRRRTTPLDGRKRVTFCSN